MLIIITYIFVVICINNNNNHNHDDGDNDDSVFTVLGRCGLAVWQCEYDLARTIHAQKRSGGYATQYGASWRIGAAAAAAVGLHRARRAHAMQQKSIFPLLAHTCLCAAGPCLQLLRGRCCPGRSTSVPHCPTPQTWCVPSRAWCRCPHRQ